MEHTVKRYLLCIILFGVMARANAEEVFFDKFEKAAWRVSSTWNGQAELRKDKKQAFAGIGYCELKATGEAGKSYGRCVQPVKIADPWGKRCVYTIRAKGAGMFRIGVILYVANNTKKDAQKTIWGETKKLTAQYEEVRFEFETISENITRIALLAEVQGDGSTVSLDDAAIEEVTDRKFLLRTDVSHLVVPTNTPRPALTFRLTSGDTPVAAKDVKIRLPDIAQLLDVVSSDSGIVIAPGGTASENTAVSLNVKAAHMASGACAETWVDVTTPERFAEMNVLAEKIKIATPIKVLFLGDSLSDFDRGHNYIDKVGFFVAKYNPGKAEFFNFGVSGDDCQRVLARLDVDKKAIHSARYEGIFARKYNLAFIFLGHNDTKAASEEKYERPLVEPQAQEECYQKIIQRLRQEGIERIVMISPFSSDSDVCKANAQKMSGKSHSLFGEPKYLEAFDNVLKRLSTELSLARIDVYTSSRDHPQKALLFRPNDGVHLSMVGHDLVAREVLRYLSQPASVK